MEVIIVCVFVGVVILLGMGISSTYTGRRP